MTWKKCGSPEMNLSWWDLKLKKMARAEKWSQKFVSGTRSAIFGTPEMAKRTLFFMVKDSKKT